MTIGDRIKEKRKERHMTQEKLAGLSNTSKQNISKYENNVITNIPTDQIERISRALNVSPAYIMGWNEDLFPQTYTLNQDERYIIDAFREADTEDRMEIMIAARTARTNIEKNNTQRNGNGTTG